MPAFIAIAVQNGGNDGKNSERGLEYDTMSDRLARFIHDEVLPAVLANAEIKAAFPKLAFTQNPWGRAVHGLQFGRRGGVDAWAWFRPDLFRRVIAYSGTFVDQQDDDAAEEAKYPARRLGVSLQHEADREERKETAAHLHARLRKRSARQRCGGDLSQLGDGWRTHRGRPEGQRLPHRYVFSRATGHCDKRVFEQTLADTLVWVWRGYKEQ